MNGARESARSRLRTVNPLAYYKEFNKVRKKARREPHSLRPEAGENGRGETEKERERKRKCAKESERENSLFSVRTGMLYFILGPVHINGEQREIFFFFQVGVRLANFDTVFCIALYNTSEYFIF